MSDILPPIFFIFFKLIQISFTDYLKTHVATTYWQNYVIVINFCYIKQSVTLIIINSLQFSQLTRTILSIIYYLMHHEILGIELITTIFVSYCVFLLLFIINAPFFF